MAFFDKARDAEPTTPREIGKLNAHARTCGACLDTHDAACKVHRLGLVWELQVEGDHAAQLVEEVGAHEEPRAADARDRPSKLHRFRIVVCEQPHPLARAAPTLCS